MRGRFLILVLAALCLPLSSQGAAERRLVHGKAVEYPDIARQFRLSGTVKLQLTIAPDGSVTKVTPLGGHPILVQDAAETVKTWKFAPADRETIQTLVLHFQP